MSLARIPLRAAARPTRTCTRCLSTSPDILDVLSSRSPSQSHPSNPKPQARDSREPLSAFRLAKETMPARPSTPEQMASFAKTENFTKQMFRKWNRGDVYSPHDLSGAEQKKWKKGRTTPQNDAFDVLGINPINEYKNYTMMSEFMTEMGRIRHSKITGLRPVNQRKIAKAIRRAIGLGLMPSVHRHPLVLKKSNPTRFM